MNWIKLKYIFISLVVILLVLFFYFSFGFSKENGFLSAGFILTNEAKIIGVMVLLSIPAYGILKRKTKNKK